MRYYGDKVDENELAQVANTGTAGGTSTNNMLDALKKLSARLKVRVRAIPRTKSFSPIPGAPATSSSA